MARSDPEKLAQALRANLRRRKAPPPVRPPEPARPPAGQAPPQSPDKPPEKSG